MTKRRKICTWDDRIELEIAWEDTFGEHLPKVRQNLVPVIKRCIRQKSQESLWERTRTAPAEYHGD